MVANSDIDEVNKYPLYVPVKANVYNDCGPPLLGNSNYILGQAIIVSVDYHNIEKYLIIFDTGVTFSVATTLVDLCDGRVHAMALTSTSTDTHLHMDVGFFLTQNTLMHTSSEEAP